MHINACGKANISTACEAYERYFKHFNKRPQNIMFFALFRLLMKMSNPHANQGADFIKGLSWSQAQSFVSNFCNIIS